MYSSQRALSFLPELKRNKFAWDILNQSHRFSMFWKNASASDIGWLNTTFVCCFLWRNRELVSPRSYVRERSLVMFRSRQLHVVWNILWRRIFFLPGNFSTGEFFCRGIFRVLTRIELKFIGFKYEAWISCCCSVKLRHTPLARSHSLACANTCGGWVSWINYFFIASSLNQSVT